MSATLSDLVFAPSSATFAATRRVIGNHVFPVGARFRRRNAAREAAYLAGEHTVSAGHAPVFPVGARFRRRSDADAVMYAAEFAAAGGRVLTSTRRLLPVGARFPRR